MLKVPRCNRVNLEFIFIFAFADESEFHRARRNETYNKARRGVEENLKKLSDAMQKPKQDRSASKEAAAKRDINGIMTLLFKELGNCTAGSRGRNLEDDLGEKVKTLKTLLNDDFFQGFQDNSEFQKLTDECKKIEGRFPSARRKANGSIK